jgi:hypothetical protein
VLSRVSKPINAAVARLLWRSIDVLITIDSDWNHIVVQEVRQTHIRHAKHLHLRSNTQCATYSQCPHTQDGLYFEPEFSETISEQTTWILNHLSVKAESLLTRLSDGQLQSFRYYSPRSSYDFSSSWLVKCRQLESRHLHSEQDIRDQWSYSKKPNISSISFLDH